MLQKHKEFLLKKVKQIDSTDTRTATVNQKNNPINDQDSKEANGDDHDIILTIQKTAEKQKQKRDGLEAYLTNEYLKLTVGNKKGLKSYFKVLWQLRSLLITVMAHFFDTASDIALVLEWYILAQKQEKDETFLEGVDMRALFICSLSVLIYYRIESTVEVFRFSQSWKDTILQFLFDFYLIKAIYVNIYKMHSYKSLSFVKIIRSLEGSTESTFQAILALVFLIKINWNDITALVSLITSMYSLISRLIFQDSSFLNDSAKDSNVEFDDIWNCQWIKKINGNFINFTLFRAIDAITTMFGIALFWHILGGLWVTIVFAPILLVITAIFKATSISSNFLTMSLKTTPMRVGTHRKEICNFWQPRIFAVIRISWLSLMMICYMNWVQIGGKAENTKAQESKSDWYLLYCVIGCWLLGTIIIPIWHTAIITKWVLPGDDRTSVSRHFSMRNAIQTNDIQFVEFARYMGINAFFETKGLKLYRMIRYCKCIPCRVLVIHKRYEKKQYHRLLYFLIEADCIDKLSDEMYYLLRDWYHDYIDKYNSRLLVTSNIKPDGNKKTRDNGGLIELDFERYLFCQEGDIYVSFINKTKCETLKLLLKENDFDMECDVMTNTNLNLLTSG